MVSLDKTYRGQLSVLIRPKSTPSHGALHHWLLARRSPLAFFASDSTSAPCSFAVLKLDSAVSTGVKNGFRRLKINVHLEHFRFQRNLGLFIAIRLRKYSKRQRFLSNSRKVAQSQLRRAFQE